MRFTCQGCPKGTPGKTSMYPLRGGCKGKDVRVAKCRRAVLLGCGTRHRGASTKRLPPGIHLRAVCCIAGVVPNRRAIRAGGHGINVVTQELADQVILAAATRVARCASMDLREGTRHSRCHLCMEDDSNQAAQSARGGLERRREGVVHHVDVLAIRRDRRSCVVAVVTGGLDVPRSRPRVAAISGLTEHYVRGGSRAAHVRQDDSVGRIRARGGAVGDVDRGSPCQVVASAGDAVLDGPPEDGVELTRMGDSTGDLEGLAPVVAAVGGTDQELEVLLRGRVSPDAEDGHVTLAVGADRAAVERLDLPVVGGRRDLLLRPRVAAVGGGSDDQRSGNGVSLLLAPERGPAQVHVAEERAARGVVSPDLLLVAERRRRLLGDDHGGLPRVCVIGRCGRDIVRARDRDGLEAIERLRTPARSRSTWEGCQSAQHVGCKRLDLDSL